MLLREKLSAARGNFETSPLLCPRSTRAHKRMWTHRRARIRTNMHCRHVQFLQRLLPTRLAAPFLCVPPMLILPLACPPPLDSDIEIHVAEVTGDHVAEALSRGMMRYADGPRDSLAAMGLEVSACVRAGGREGVRGGGRGWGREGGREAGRERVCMCFDRVHALRKHQHAGMLEVVGFGNFV